MCLKTYLIIPRYISAIEFNENIQTEQKIERERTQFLKSRNNYIEFPLRVNINSTNFFWLSETCLMSRHETLIPIMKKKLFNLFSSFNLMKCTQKKHYCLSVNNSKVGGEIFHHYQQLHHQIRITRWYRWYRWSITEILKFTQHPRRPGLSNCALGTDFFFKTKSTLSSVLMFLPLMGGVNQTLKIPRSKSYCFFC